MPRKLLLSLLVFALGVGVYLSGSGGPLRIHTVEVGFQFVFLLIGSLLAWWPSIGARKRALLACFLLLAGSIARNALLDQVLGKGFPPLYPPYLVAGVVLLAAELFLVVGLVWLLDRLLVRLSLARPA